MNSEKTSITIDTLVNAPLSKVWDCWTEPGDITHWNNASPNWHCPRAENNLTVGGTFSARMESVDGSQGFDFGGTYTEVIPLERIAYVLGDDRKVEVTFSQQGEQVHVVETFDAESTNSVELQRGGWQSILDNFKKYVESK